VKLGPDALLGPSRCPLLILLQFSWWHMRLSSAFKAFSFLLLLFLSTNLAYAQRPSGGHMLGGTIDVQLRFADGRPGPRDIHVRLEAAEGGAEADLETIQGGKCQFHQKTSGVFVVRVSGQGFKEVSERVELIDSPMAYVVLTLIPVNPEPQPAISVPAAGSPQSISVADLAIPESARQEMAKGQDALRARNTDEAVKHFQKAIKIYKAYPQAYHLLGEAYAEQQQWPDAESALKRSIELEPKLADSYLDLGAIRNQTKNYVGAEEALKKGLELMPEFPMAQYELAKTYSATGRWQEAAPLAETAVKGLPDLAPAHVVLANIRLKQRNGPAALHEYQEYLRLAPEGPMAPQVRDVVAKLQGALPQQQ
jgi:Tfp pilus assembly protein PilF